MMPQNVRIYLRISTAFQQGYLRLLGYQQARAGLNVAYLCAKRVPEAVVVEDPGLLDALAHLRDIEDDDYEALEHVGGISDLVYATTLIDTFLTEATLFLYLLNPKSIGAKVNVSVETLISSASKYQALTEVAVKKVREHGHLPLLARVEVLRGTFGLKISLAEEISQILQRVSALRNAVVHDQGLSELVLDERGIEAVERAGSHSVTHDDVDAAMHAFRDLEHEVSSAVLNQVLHAQNISAVQDYLIPRHRHHGYA